MANKIDSRQITYKGTLSNLSGTNPTEADNLFSSIDAETTPPLRLNASATPDLIIAVGPAIVANPETGRNHSIPHIGKLLPNSFTSGTITFPAASGGNITTSTGGSTVLTVTSGNFIKVLIYMDPLGNLLTLPGVQAASAAVATVLKAPSKGLAIGYVLLQNVGGVIQNIPATSVYQFGSGGGGGSSAESFDLPLVNNQVAPADLTEVLIDSVDNRGFSLDYTVSRRSVQAGSPAIPGSEGIAETFMNNAVDGSKFISSTRTAMVQTDGKIVVVGDFFNYDGLSGRAELIRFNADGTLDTAFCNNAVDGKINGDGYDLEIQSDGKIIFGGGFSNYGGTTGRKHLIRLNADGTLDTAFCNNASDGNKFNNVVFFVKLQSDGKILVGGVFSNYGGTTGRNYLIRLNSDGTTDTAFCTNASDSAKLSNSILDIQVQSDGKILVGGSFTNYGGTTGRNYLIRLNSDGTLDTTFCNNASDSAKFDSYVLTCKIQSDGKILVGGNFNNYAGTSGRNYLIRLNSDGTTDTAFCVIATDGTKFSYDVYGAISASDGGIYVGGYFSNYDGVTGRSRFMKLNADGSLNTAFNTTYTDGEKFNGNLYGISISGNFVFACGYFADYGSVTGRDCLLAIETIPEIPAVPDITTELQSTGNIKGVYKPGTSVWALGAESYMGDDTGVDFSITPAGQVQYVSTNLPGTVVESLIKLLLNKI